MPTYDYRCDHGHVFEVFHSMTDDSPRVCPECGAPAKRVPGGGAGLLFKGSGFYATDHRSSAYREKAKSESPTPAEPKKPSEGPGKSD
ncbi:MAG: zinc ribbon domain-containing protein [Candidatus Eisenbacteria bacterium]|nr:zinc ribbon domain-containing protein [Candidatus Eisenbacteria bacterium]